LTGSTFMTAATWSYGVALALYLLFALRVLLGWKMSTRALVLEGALVASVLWAAGAIATARTQEPLAVLGMNAGDLARYGLWLAFLGNLLGGPEVAPGERSGTRSSRVTVVAPIVGALLICLLLSPGLPFAEQVGPGAPQIELALRLGLAILGLVMVEQLVRRAHRQAQWSLRPLAIALAGIFAFDLFLYSDAMLFNRVDLDFWVARAVAHTLVLPLIAIATARNTGWTVDMHLSRNVVFHSTALVASGVFVLAVAAAGYLVRYFGGEWGSVLQAELLFAAILAAALIATSGRFRSRLRVFVSKHFFSYRYDYREEWLRFTRTLAQEGDPARLPERVMMALCDLLESPGGALWLREEGRGFVPAGRYNLAQPGAVEPDQGSLVSFLTHTGWVVELADYRVAPAKYRGLELPAWLAGMPSAWLVAPLPGAGGIEGFAVLADPRAPVQVDWEVRDLVKTASRQAASYLAQARASDALLEARKFDAFNRMAAFVVHDLKNLVAQLSLLLRNAERHRDNPDFQRDMLETVQHVVERMNGLMLQLGTSAKPVVRAHAVDLAPLVRGVCGAKSDDEHPVRVEIAAEAIALGHEDRLEHVIGHLVQNALDASRPGQAVRVRLDREGGEAVIEVTDEGAGMTDAYVRERLGKPFESTKPAGMGIGVYESSQYVASVGGRLAIDSAPGRGTSVRVSLPLAETAGPAPRGEAVPNSVPADAAGAGVHH
jgi:putative PEP-CTERM system histidine kinase